MKTKLFTQNSCFAMLIMLVLVFGVQGIADALTLTRVSNKVQSNLEGSTFDIKFSVGLKSDTTQIKNSDGKLIDDSATPRRIDGQGYLVTVIDGTDYRNTTVTDANANAAQLVPPTPNTPDPPSGLDATNSSTTAYQAYAVYEKVSSSQYVGPYTSAIFANSSKSAFSNRGYALHYYTAGFNYDGSDADTDEDDVAPAKISSQIKIRDEQFQPRLDKSNRYHYNDEAIAISVDAGMTVRLKSGSTTYPVNVISTVPTARPAALSETTASLWEGGGIRSLPTSITLNCTSATAGAYTITITDVSPANDFPDNAPETLEQAQIEFTLYVEEDAAPTGTLDFSTATGSLLRLETKRAVEPIHTHFDLETDAINLPAHTSIRYKVTEGSGLLYVGTPTREDITPLSDLTIHKDAMVYLKTNQTDNEVVAAIAGQDLRTHGKTLVFEYTGSGRRSPTSGPTPPTPPTPPTNTITVSPASIEGAAGTTQSLTVSAGTAAVRVLGDAAFTAAGGTISGTGSARSVTLPDSPGSTYNLTLSASTYADIIVPVTVTGSAQPGTLTIRAIGARSGNQQAIQVTAQPSGGGTPSSAVVVTLTGVTIPTTLTIPAGSDSRTVAATLLSASAPQALTASADGYNTGRTTIAAPGQPAQQPPVPTPPSTASAPSRIIVGGPSTRSGTVNEALEAPLLAQVLDAGGNGVPDVTVIFRVTAGRGRLSQRGAGNAVGERTDSQGYARASGFTPLSAGKITIEAVVRGVTQKAVFTITTGLAPATGTPGTGETPTPSTTVSPVLNAGVSAASRPPMLWVSGGKIYALVGSDVEVFISNVENATNLTVGGGKVYWTAQTSENYGTLNSANLDGTDAKQLRSLWGVPRGITLDLMGSKLYWVDAANRLQRSNLDGSGIENVIRGLSEPKHVALSGGNVYWIGNGSGTDTLSFINLSDPKKEINPIAATSGVYGDLTIVGSKLYWTEQTSDSHGTIYSANLDGTQVKELPAEPIWGAPIGIAVDTARSRLYWTDAVGRLQRANLDASGIHNVAKGLGHLGDLVISNSIMEPAGTTPTTPTPTPTASKSKYDVNGDGTVNSKDIDVLIVAILAELTDDKYDVNDDGKVDVSDVKAVNANLDAGAAGAPTLLGTKLSAVQIDRLQEQIDLLVASNDRSPVALKTLIYLQQLLATARPEKTQLLANYPNPFNPETWIPYELATDTNAKITIYNAQGVVIRTLQLGQQSAGYYTDRERAAYWDGRNALGEQVASGIYFYQLQTDTMSTLRKMVILK